MLVYKITNSVNGKIYIGQTVRSLVVRWKSHLQDSKKSQYAIHRAIRKYGAENFKIEIVEEVFDISKLSERECWWIENCNSMNPKIGYNMISKVDGVKILNDETKKKMSESCSLFWNTMTKERKAEEVKNRSFGKQGIKRSHGKSSKYVGVTKNLRCNSWQVSIAFLGKRYRKSFKYEEMAAMYYDSIAISVYGANAKLNFPINPQFLLKHGE